MEDQHQEKASRSIIPSLTKLPSLNFNKLQLPSLNFQVNQSNPSLSIPPANLELSLTEEIKILIRKLWN